MSEHEWPCKTGSTLLVPSGPSGMHLFFIILGPLRLVDYGTTPQVLMVSSSTIRDGIPHDPACVLKSGDHPFIRHDSYITYRHIRTDSVFHVEKMVSSSVWSPREPCNEILLARIVDGVNTSKLIPRGIKPLFKFC